VGNIDIALAWLGGQCDAIPRAGYLGTKRACCDRCCTRRREIASTSREARRVVIVRRKICEWDAAIAAAALMGLTLTYVCSWGNVPSGSPNG
jgi:hypothetical protein